jgi:hypothetical protein
MLCIIYYRSEMYGFFRGQVSHLLRLFWAVDVPCTVHVSCSILEFPSCKPLFHVLYYRIYCIVVTLYNG